MEKLRVFVGIPVPLSFKTYINQFIQKNAHIENVRWITFENLHITLFFIGTIEKRHISLIINTISEIFSNSRSFSLQFETYKLAPDKRPRMIWAKFQENDLFINLSNKISTELVRFRKPDHYPNPHITLARSGKNLYKVKLNQAEPLPEINVDKIVLWQSNTYAQGAEYTALHFFELNKL